MREGKATVVGPQGIRGNVFNNDRFAPVCSRAARPGGWAYRFAIHGSDVPFRQTGRRAVTHVHAIGIEQQNRSQHAWTLFLDDAQKRIEGLFKRRSLSNEHEDPVLSVQQFGGFFGGPFRSFLLRDVVKEDRESVDGWKNPIFVPAIPRLVIALDLNKSLLSQRLFAGRLKRLLKPFRELRPNVFFNKVFRVSAKELPGLVVQVGVTPVLVESNNGVTHSFKNIARIMTWKTGFLGNAAVPWRPLRAHIGDLLQCLVANGRRRLSELKRVE